MNEALGIPVVAIFHCVQCLRYHNPPLDLVKSLQLPLVTALQMALNEIIEFPMTA